MKRVQEDFAITALRVGGYLEEKFKTYWPEVQLTDTLGKEPYGPQETFVYGFILGRGARKSPFVRFITGAKLRPMIAKLWFVHHGASPIHWIFHVYGAQHSFKFERLAQGLGEEFHVRVSVVLMSRSERTEYESEHETFFTYTD